MCADQNMAETKEFLQLGHKEISLITSFMALYFVVFLITDYTGLTARVVNPFLQVEGKNSIKKRNFDVY